MGDRAVYLQRGATVSAVLLSLFKAGVVNERTPVWDFDAWSQAAPMTGIGPGTGVLIDAAVVLLSAVSLLAVARRGRSVRWSWLVLAATGVVAVAAHSALAGGAWVEVFAPEGAGSAWIAAIAAMVACAHASRDRWLHRVVVGLGLGFVGVLLAKGLVQVVVEHPQTMRAFRIDREAILAARGWDADSAAARSFERRLSQPEATGWFGLANVYASFMAVALVGFGAAAAAWAVSTSSVWRERGWWVVVLGAVCGAVGLWMSGSKGGLGAAFVAGGGVAVAAWSGSRGRKRAPWIGPGLIALVLLGVAVRGVIGPAFGELSLLFRAFYAEGAVRIFAQNPLLGVGPGGFQDAYLLAKPPLSPEAVTSPHSVLLDWLSMLGVGGLAWGVLFVLVAWSLGRAFRVQGSLAARSRLDWKVVLLLAGVVVLMGASIERAATTAEAAVGRLVGLGLWVAFGAVVIRALPARALRVAAGAAALTLIVHGQIELTPVQPESAVLAFVLVGLGVPPCVDARKPRLHAGVTLGFAGVAVCMAALMTTGAGRLFAWQSKLLEGADAVAPMAEASVGGPPVSSREADAMLAAAERLLGEAADLRPAHEPTVKAFGRTAGARSTLDTADGSGVLASVGAARRLTELVGSASAEGWLGVSAISVAGSGLVGGAEADALRAEGEAALLRSAELDPYSVPPAVRLADYFSDTGEPERAAEWARAALDRDALTGLDPLIGLTERQRARIEAILAGI